MVSIVMINIGLNSVGLTAMLAATGVPSVEEIGSVLWLWLAGAGEHRVPFDTAPFAVVLVAAFWPLPCLK